MRRSTYLVVVSRSEEDWNESQPNNARAVHREADIFRFIEVLGNFSRFESVPRTQKDEDHVVNERQNEGKRGDAARPDGLFARRIDFTDRWIVDEKPHENADKLDRH